MERGQVTNIHIQNNIQNLLLICCCAGASRCSSRCCHANQYPTDTWDRPRVIRSGAVSPSVVGPDNRIKPVE